MPIPVLNRERGRDQSGDSARQCPHVRVVETWDPDGVDPVIMCLDCEKWDTSDAAFGLSIPEEEEEF